MTATLKDVAGEAGLNVSTVSRILNNRGYISCEARDRVDAAMKKLHYQRNEAARSLRCRQSHLIGVIMEEISDPLWSKALEEAVQILGQSGWQVLLFQAGRDEEGIFRCLSQCMARQTDGVILMADAPTAKEEYPFPLISIGEWNAPSTALQVRCDFPAAGRLAAEYLTSRGHQPLFHVYEEGNAASQQCREGFSEICMQKTVSFSEIPFSDSGAYRLLYAAARFGRQGQAAGVFVSSPAAAEKILAAADSLGIRIPENLALICTDDGRGEARYGQLSAWIRPDIIQMVSCACKALLSAVQEGTLPEEMLISMKYIPAQRVRAKAV